MEYCAPGSRNKFRGAVASLHFSWEGFNLEAEDAKNLCVNCAAQISRVLFILSVEFDFVSMFASLLPQSLVDGVRGWDDMMGKIKMHCSWPLVLYNLRTAKQH